MPEFEIPADFDPFMEEVEIEGTMYRRIPWGSESVFDEGCPGCGAARETAHEPSCPRAANLGESIEPGRPTWACRDCRVEIGKLHAFNCGLESCPRCDRQFASCECNTPWDYPDGCDPDLDLEG